MIRIKNMSMKYDTGPWILKDLTCQIEQGEFIYVVGPSGAGKSTLLKILMCEEKSKGGFVSLGNINLSKVHDLQIPSIRRQLGIVTQQVLLLEHATVYQNIVYALQATGVHYKEIKSKANDALSLVGMSEYKNFFPSDLSVGQQQKIAIARAIANKPKIILADEPTGNLDNKSSIEMMKILYQLNELGATVIMSTHNSTIVNTVRYRVIEMKEGKIIRDQKDGSYGLPSDSKDVFLF